MFILFITSQLDRRRRQLYYMNNSPGSSAVYQPGAPPLQADSAVHASGSIYHPWPIQRGGKCCDFATKLRLYWSIS